MKKHIIIVFTLSLVIFTGLCGCTQQQNTNNPDTTDDLNRFVGTWQMEPTEYEQEYNMTATYTFYTNSSLEIVYNVSYQGYENVQRGWGNYTVNDTKLCITALDQDGCGMYNFSDDMMTLTLTSSDTGEITSTLRKQ